MRMIHLHADAKQVLLSAISLTFFSATIAWEGVVGIFEDDLDLCCAWSSCGLLCAWIDDCLMSLKEISIDHMPTLAVASNLALMLLCCGSPGLARLCWRWNRGHTLTLIEIAWTINNWQNWHKALFSGHSHQWMSIRHKSQSLTIADYKHIHRKGLFIHHHQNSAWFWCNDYIMIEWCSWLYTRSSFTQYGDGLCFP